ncbi:MAG: di-heme enzyme [Polyangiaceae bacterium]
MGQRVAVAVFIAAALGAACEDPPDDAPPPPDDSALRALLGVPDGLETPVVPAYNPPTAEKIALGRRLFYEKQLSGNGTQSCGGCHAQNLAFADGKISSVGSTGQLGHRNSPGLANVAYFSTLTWANSGLLDLEDQIPVPIRGDNPVELGVNDGVVDEVMARFDADPGYASMFAAAFPESASGATVNKVVYAIASFLRTFLSGGSPYDRFLAGDATALDEQQRRGYALFNGERLECFHCHRGANLTVSYFDVNVPDGSRQTPFFNNGLYNVDGEGSYPAIDQGLYDLTLNPSDRGLFRPPSLRNVALTAPYMHDGSIATLRDVVRHYAAGGRLIESGPNAGDGRISPLKSGLVRGFEISESEIDDVVAFLGALTDPTFLQNPALAPP